MGQKTFSSQKEFVIMSALVNSLRNALKAVEIQLSLERGVLRLSEPAVLFGRKEGMQNVRTSEHQNIRTALAFQHFAVGEHTREEHER
jgi:DnaJ-domain-containing protein 1